MKVQTSSSSLCEYFPKRIIKPVPRIYQIKKMHRLLEKASLVANILVIIAERSGLGKLDLSLPPMGHPVSLIISL